MRVTQIVTQFVTQAPEKMRQFTIQRGTTFWFSRRVPQLAGQVITLSDRPPMKVGKNGYLRFSLGTGNPKEAARLARAFAVEIDRLLFTAQAPRPAPPEPATAADIAAGADRLRAMLAAAIVETHQSQVNRALSGEPTPDDPDEAEAIAAATVDLPLSGGPDGDARLLRALAESGLLGLTTLQSTGRLPTGPVSASHTPAAAAVRKAAKQSADMIDQGTPLPSPPPPAWTWNDTLAYYFEHHQLAPASRKKYRLALDKLSKFANCSPAQLTRAQTIGWRDSMLSAGRVASTVKLDMTNAGAMHRWSRINGKLGESPGPDPFELVRVARTRAAPPRHDFTLSELQTIFDRLHQFPPPPAAGGPAAFWLVTAALLTGARRGELWGLRVEDVRFDEEGGGWYLAIEPNLHRALKTAPSRRNVPVSARLAELGFLRFVEAMRSAGADRLFQPINKPDKPSEWFAKVLQASLGPQQRDTMLNFHSLRHTFMTFARLAGVADRTLHYLAGHAKSISDQYGSVPLVTLRQPIDSVVFSGLTIAAPPPLTKADAVDLLAQATRRARSGADRAATMARRAAVIARRQARTITRTPRRSATARRTS